MCEIDIGFMGLFVGFFILIIEFEELFFVLYCCGVNGVVFGFRGILVILMNLLEFEELLLVL